MAKAKATKAAAGSTSAAAVNDGTTYPAAALGTRTAAQAALQAALRRRPNLEADLADVIAYVGLPAEGN